MSVFTKSHYAFSITNT